MNEQLQAALTKLIEQVSSGAATAQAALPEALQQYIAYSRVASVKMMIFCASLTAVLMVSIFVSWLFNRSYGEAGVSRFIMTVVAVISAVVGIIYYQTYLQTFYPQAFILDMLRGMMAK